VRGRRNRERKPE
jgi:hypothetical protein